MKHLKSRRYFTLLETLIAISLVAVLLTIVFGFFKELSELSRQTEEQQKASFRARYVQTRLAFIFERLVNENEGSKRKFYFFTQGPDKGLSPSTSLVFTFNNEVRANPAFSDDLLARLYVDDHHCLCLAMWPLYSDQPHQEMQKEVLLQNVADMKYEFYMPPERALTQTNINPNKTDPEKREPEHDKWHLQEWYDSYKQMPAILRLTIKIAANKDDLKSGRSAGRIETQDLVFAFVLPSSKNYIYYPPN